MLQPIRAVSTRSNPRCPQCHCFVRLNSGTCTACGFAFALGIEARQGQDTRLHVGLDLRKPGPQGNAQSPLSNLQPNGKIKKQKKITETGQLELFTPVEKIDCSAWLQQGVIL